MAFSLPPLPYEKNALVPHISAETLEYHHGKHHAAYVKGSNEALEKIAEARNATGCGELTTAIARTIRGCSTEVAQHTRPPSAWPTSVADLWPSARTSPAVSPASVQPS